MSVVVEEPVVEEWRAEYAVEVELEEGRVVEAVASTLVEALRKLADVVEEATR